MAKDKKPGYLGTLGQVAPSFGLKAILGDLPKGSVEYATERKLRGSKSSFKSLLSQGARGRGGGRAIGGGVGILTAPLFMRGLKNVGSKDPKKRRTGLALLGSTAAVYQGQRGFIEGYRAARSVNLGKGTAARRGLILGGTRAAYKTPSAIALGLSIASGRKRSRQKGGSKYDKFLIPALSGASLGALARGAESMTMSGMGEGGRKGLMEAFRRAAPAAGGGAVGGLLGGLVLSAAVDGAMKAMKKESSVTMASVGAASSMLGESIKGMLGHGLPYVFPGHMVSKAGMGYGKAGIALSKSAPGVKVLGRMNKAKTEQLAIGMREGLAGRRDPGWRSGIGLGMTFPELKYNRQMGIEIGRLLRGVPSAYRERVLEGSKKYITPTMRWSKKGEPVPVLNQLPDAIDLAIGKKPLFKGLALGSGYSRLVHGGRGSYSQRGKRIRGLPKALAGDTSAHPIGPDLALLGGGIGLAGATAATGGLAAIPLSILGSHSLIGGAKGLGVRLPFVKKKALKSGAAGIREAFLPGMKKPLGENILEHGMDIGISPASRDWGRMVGGVARGVAEFGRAGMKGKLQKGVSRAASPRKLTFSEAATAPVLGGAALAGADKLRRNRKRR